MVPAIIKKLEDSFLSAEINFKGGARIVMRNTASKGAKYWARTKAGGSLEDVGEEGLARIQTILAGLDAEERAMLLYALKDIGECGIANSFLVVNQKDNDYSYEITAMLGDDVKLFEFSNVGAFITEIRNLMPEPINNLPEVEVGPKAPGKI